MIFAAIFFYCVKHQATTAEGMFGIGFLAFFELGSELAILAVKL